MENTYGQHQRAEDLDLPMPKLPRWAILAAIAALLVAAGPFRVFIAFLAAAAVVW